MRFYLLDFYPLLFTLILIPSVISAVYGGDTLFGLLALPSLTATVLSLFGLKPWITATAFAVTLTICTAGKIIQKSKIILSRGKVWNSHQ